jgi:hypothetical protein
LFALNFWLVVTGTWLDFIFPNSWDDFLQSDELHHFSAGEGNHQADFV